MIKSISTVDDVKIFFKQLFAEGLNFHPDDPFEDYINTDTKEPFYTEEEAKVREILICEAFEVCENENIDIYEICIEIFEFTGDNQLSLF